MTRLHPSTQPTTCVCVCGWNDNITIFSRLFECFICLGWCWTWLCRRSDDAIRLFARSNNSRPRISATSFFFPRYYWTLDWQLCESYRLIALCVFGRRRFSSFNTNFCRPPVAADRWWPDVCCYRTSPGVKIRPVHSSVVTASHPCFLWFRFCWVHTRLLGSLSSLFFVWFRETSSFSPFSLCVSNRAPLEFPPFDGTPTKFFPYSSVPCRRHITINT